jgi:monoamine oxidase
MGTSLRHITTPDGTALRIRVCPNESTFAVFGTLGQAGTLPAITELMPALSRRSLLASSTALAAASAVGAVPASGEVDVVIVGAGAAGIAAARRIALDKRPFALVEASWHIGGRCITDTEIFGVACDLGAHWIHMPDVNPVAKLAPVSGLDIYPAPAGQRLRVGRRNARQGEMEDYFAALVRSTRAISEAVRGRADVSCEQALPKDLGEWRGCVEFVLGPFGCGKSLDVVSAVDFASSAERDSDAFCRQGFGAPLVRLSERLNVQLGTRVTAVAALPRGIVEVMTSQGKLRAQAVIVTVSTAVLAAGDIRFSPELPKRCNEALAKLTLGSYDHIVLELPGNPLGLRSDDLVFEKVSDQHTGALLANISGTPLCSVEVAGAFGRRLASDGEGAMVTFARDWLADLFGADVKVFLRRAHATRWHEQPFARGSFSAAAPGGHWGRKILMEPVHDRIFFAGEAVHDTLWGTVGGAWESGERAADAVLKRLRRG